MNKPQKQPPPIKEAVNYELEKWKVATNELVIIGYC